MHADVLQLTDLHLMCEREKTMRGVRTYDALVEMLRFIDAGVQTGRWDVDHIVITGDLTHDERFETYELFREVMGEWMSRCRLVPGNHDDRALMRRVIPELVPQDGAYINFSLEAGGWRLIGLDSHIEGDGAGHIDANQMGWLADQLTHFHVQPTILFVHHPPFYVGSAWLDNVSLREPKPLLDLIASFPQVRAISAGHVHQQFQGRLGGIELLTTPSTAVQYRLHEDLPVCDLVPPGLRAFKFDGDSFSTEVVRLPELKFPPSD